MGYVFLVILVCVFPPIIVPALLFMLFTGGPIHGFKERTRYVSPEKKEEMFEEEFHKWVKK